MSTLHLLKPLAVFILALLTNTLYASAIYPIDRASILAGSKFDIKVELNSEINLSDLTLEMNGVPLNSVLGKKGDFIANENGKGSAIIFRDVELRKPGKYVLTAQISQERLEVIWDV